jgi:hypothetical protein
VYKRGKPQVNALIVNDLGVELTEETLSQPEIEDTLAAEILFECNARHRLWRLYESESPCLEQSDAHLGRFW